MDELLRELWRARNAGPLEKLEYLFQSERSQRSFDAQAYTYDVTEEGTFSRGIKRLQSRSSAEHPMIGDMKRPLNLAETIIALSNRASAPQSVYYTGTLIARKGGTNLIKYLNSSVRTLDWNTSKPYRQLDFDQFQEQFIDYNKLKVVKEGGWRLSRRRTDWVYPVTMILVPCADDPDGLNPVFSFDVPRSNGRFLYVSGKQKTQQ